MKPVFADTSFFVAWAGLNDPLHRHAVELAESLPSRIVTTEYVLIETGGLLLRLEDRLAYGSLVRDVLSDPQMEVVAATRQLFQRGFDLFVSRPDKRWSMVDCISFVVMKQRRLTEALTADCHFEQAGFRA